jgi:ABC-2 type transport system permease protein
VEWSAQFASPEIARLLTHLSVMEHFGDFAKGVLDLHHALFYVGLTLFFLAATARVLELRRARGL